MRKLPALFVLSASIATVTGAMQACSSGDGAADLGPQDGGNVVADATIEDTGTDGSSSGQVSSSSSSGQPPKNTKPTDGGIDTTNLGPGEHVLQIGNCDTFAACGGDVDGKQYDYAGGCFDEDGLEDSLQQYCEDIDVYDSRAVVSGHLNFSAGTQYDHELKLRFSGNILIPGTCDFLAFIGGCEGISTQLSSAGFSGLTCYDPAEGEGCDCIIATERTELGSGPYAIAPGEADAAGTELSLQGADGGATVLPYCVNETTMKHQQRSGGGSTSIADPGAYMTWQLQEGAGGQP